MEIKKYNLQLDEKALENNFVKIINQTYKLLPLRQQGKDWKKPLESIIEQLSGMKRLIDDYDSLFFSILCKLEGLYQLQSQEDMLLFRRIIFKSLQLIGALKNNVCNR